MAQSTVRTAALEVGSPCLVELDGDQHPATVTAVLLNRLFRVQVMGEPDTYSVPLAKLTAHADYPHGPGTLYDCPACELACHCSADDLESGDVACISGKCQAYSEMVDEYFGPDALELAHDAYEASGMAGAYLENDL